MENRMDVAMFFADSVKNSSNSVGNAAAKKQEKAGQGNRLNGYLCRKNNTPTHADIADHRKFRVLFEVDCRQRDCHCCKSPNKREDRPRP